MTGSSPKGCVVETTLVLAFCGLALLACRRTIEATGTRPSAAVTEEGEIPAAAFFRAPLLSHVTISPDGQHVAAVYAKDGAEILVVSRLGEKATRPVAKLEREHARSSITVRTLGWPGNDRLLVSLEMPAPFAVGVRARQTRLMVVELEGGAPRYLGKSWRWHEYSQSQDDIVSWLPDDPNHVLINLRLPGKGRRVRRLDIDSGVLKSVTQARSGRWGWAADHKDEIRASWGGHRTEHIVWARIRSDDSFEEIARFDRFDEVEEGDEPSFYFAGFSEDPARIYVRSALETGRDAIYEYDLASRRLGKRVFGHPRVDVGSLRVSERDDRLLSIGYVTDRSRLKFFDEAARLEQEQIDASLPDRINRFSGHSRDERYSIVVSTGDRRPPRYYVFDRDRKNLAFLFAAYPELHGAELSSMEPVQYPARDGLLIHGYLTRPAGREPPYPTIVYPHGGPWSRDVWGWDPVVQWLASRGFAVLQPNFRGSDGYGVKFLKMGYGRWGQEMQDDITDGARWLIEQGISDPDRIGIYGASYGGYAALQALVKEPELFRAGASFAGVTDITAFLADDAFYSNLIDTMEKLVGERWGDRARLKEISPANNAERIRAPVLIAHGTQDPRVHVDQAHEMADALEDAGVEVEVHLYEGEVHGFIDERNRIDFYTKLASFFERNLADRSAAALFPAPAESDGFRTRPLPSAEFRRR